jgi:hypothetical protein
MAISYSQLIFEVNNHVSSLKTSPDLKSANYHIAQISEKFQTYIEKNPEEISQVQESIIEIDKKTNKIITKQITGLLRLCNNTSIKTNIKINKDHTQ